MVSLEASLRDHHAALNIDCTFSDEAYLPIPAI